MKKCIIRYRDDKENYNCWCNSSWCDKCSTKDNRYEDTCRVASGGYCTCRLCGERNKKE